MNNPSTNVAVRYLTSWRAYFILALPTIAAVPVPRNNLEPNVVWAWLTASVIGYLAIGACLAVLRYAIFSGRQHERISFQTAAFIGAVIGFLKGFTTGGFASLLGVGLGGISEVFIRAIPATFLGAAIISLTALIVTNVVDFRVEWKGLVLTRAQALEMQAIEREELEQNASALESLISTELNVVLQKCAAALNDVDDRPVETQWQTLSSLLRQAATEHIQPLSLKLWNSPESKPPSVRTALISAAKSAQVPVIGPILLGAIAFVPARAGLVSIEVLVRELAVYLTFISLSLGPIHLLVRRVKRFHFTLLVSAGFFAGISVLLTNVVMDSEHSLGRTLLNVWWLVLLTVSFGLAQALLRQRENLFSELKAQAQSAQIEAAALRQANRRMYRELGQYLHSTVQSRLMASALLIDTNPDQDSSWYRERLEGTMRILTSPLSEFRQLEIDLASALHELANKWAGIIDVEVQIHGSSEVQRTTDVVAVVQEAVSNASRHGLARMVRVTVTLSPRGIDIDVLDDGIGPRLGPRGLGSAFFDETGPWSLTAGSDGFGSHFHMTLAA